MHHFFQDIHLKVAVLAAGDATAQSYPPGPFMPRYLSHSASNSFQRLSQSIFFRLSKWRHAEHTPSLSNVMPGARVRHGAFFAVFHPKALLCVRQTGLAVFILPHLGTQHKQKREKRGKIPPACAGMLKCSQSGAYILRMPRGLCSTCAAWRCFGRRTCPAGRGL